MRQANVSVKCISRNPEEFTKERKTDTGKLHRNLDPNLHPFEQAREYTRALNAVKLDRLFAKPLIGALDGHRDAVYCISPSPLNLSTFCSGAGDGELRAWNLQSNKCIWSAKAHRGLIRGLCTDPFGKLWISCGTDGQIKLWEQQPDLLGERASASEEQERSDSRRRRDRSQYNVSTTMVGSASTADEHIEILPTMTFSGQSPFTSVSSGMGGECFVLTHFGGVFFWGWATVEWITIEVRICLQRQDLDCRSGARSDRTRCTSSTLETSIRCQMCDSTTSSSRCLPRWAASGRSCCSMFAPSCR